MNQLSGKVAIITGVGCGGIGYGIARTFAAEGANIVINSRTEDTLVNIALEIASGGTMAAFVTGDVALEETWENLYTEALHRFGHVDIIVNNAARLASEGDGAWPDKSVWEQTLATNVTGTYLAYKQFAPYFQQQGTGVFINIASVTASVYEGGMNAYSASKASVLNISRNAAVILGPSGVRSVCVSPNFVPVANRESINARPEQQRWQHANTPLPYLGQPEDVAQACLFLASDSARYITGIDLAVDGGYSAAGFIPYPLVQDAWQYQQNQANPSKQQEEHHANERKDFCG